jgi:two-component system sensor histidine kinase YesM
MNTERTQVPLRDELEHVQNYVILQTERFGEENLRLDIDTDEAVLDVAVPKMILQPIVENIFKHGFADGILEAVIAISCSFDEQGQLVLAVKDNGKGIPEERLEEIAAGLTHSGKAEHEEIGLYNVLARLRLQMNGEAQLLLRNGEGQGVTVTLLIPLDS